MCFFKWKLRYPQVWWSQWSHVNNSTFFRHTQHILKKVMFPAIYHLKYLMISQKSPHIWLVLYPKPMNRTGDHWRLVATRSLTNLGTTAGNAGKSASVCTVKPGFSSEVLDPQTASGIFSLSTACESGFADDCQTTNDLMKFHQARGLRDFILWQGKVGLLAWEDTAERRQGPKDLLGKPVKWHG